MKMDERREVKYDILSLFLLSHCTEHESSFPAFPGEGQAHMAKLPAKS